MRPIKFRAWDKKENRMMKPDVRWLIDPTDGSIYNSIKDDYESDWVLMQFTGLHDKNGKPIFENDIVKHHYHNQVCLVQWSESRSQFELEFGEDWYPLWPIDSEHFEVLGNIYENPELLK